MKAQIKSYSKPLLGSVEVSGDSEYVVFALSRLLILEKSATLENVSRSAFVLSFINLVNKLVNNVQIRWMSPTKLEVMVGSNLSLNDGVLDNLSQDEYSEALVPCLLKLKESVIVGKSFEKNIKLLLEIGVVVRSVKSGYILSLPNGVTSNVGVSVDIRFQSFVEQAFIINISKLLFEMKLIFDESDTLAVLLYEISDTDEAKKLQKIYVPTDISEFAFYSLLSATPLSEIMISNFDISNVLPFLSAYSKIGGGYEVYNNSIKVWYQGADFLEEYDFRYLNTEIALSLIFLVSLYSNRYSQVLLRPSSEIQSVVKELNMLGCRLDYETKENNILIGIKPAKQFSNVETDLTTFQSGFVLALASIHIKGTHRLGSFENISDRFQFLQDNLNSLGVSVKVTPS